MKLQAGQSLASVVDGTTVIVVRAPATEVTVTCGGSEMVEGKTAAGAGTPGQGRPDGTQLGKRYVVDDLGLELLCTKPGGGTLAVDGIPLRLKEAKPLPASD